MLHWILYPMVRIAVFFAAGVLLGIYFPFGLPWAIALAVTFSILYFLLKVCNDQHKLPDVHGWLGLSIIFLLGYARIILFNELDRESHFTSIKEPIVAYEAVVHSAAEEKAKSWKMEVEMVMAKTTAWRPVTGKILLYVSKVNFDRSRWHYGDHILVRGGPQSIRGPANPGEFDFRRFLSFRNIGHQQLVEPNEINYSAPASQRGLMYYSFEARDWSIRKINHYLKGDNERAVAIALILGVTEGIDDDLLNAYAASGAMHLLAVSGMHVGILYAMVVLLCRPLQVWKGSRWITAGISLLVLWAFAYLTGLSPSVLRAVTMFSFIAVAKPFGRRTNIYNTLAASAFVLLLFNPYLIMSVGFQLSYLAVLGIVYWQRPIYRWWQIENRIGDWIWQITSVSIAAQAATFPLTILYFHQFPTYFLLSNLFVIPLSTIVLVGGVFLLSISFVSPVASVTGMMLMWLVKALNGIVYLTESLPFSVVDSIFISPGQCWLLYGIVATFILMVEFKSVRWFYVACVLGMVFSFLQWTHFQTSVDRQELIVYSIPRHQAVELIDRGRSYLEMDSALGKDPQKIKFHIQPNRLVNGVYEVRSEIPGSRTVNGLELFRFKNKTIAWIRNKKVKLPSGFRCDYLIVSNNALDVKEMKTIKDAMVIFDGSNASHYLVSMKNAVQKDHLHITNTNGAFVLH